MKILTILALIGVVIILDVIRRDKSSLDDNKDNELIGNMTMLMLEGYLFGVITIIVLFL